MSEIDLGEGCFAGVNASGSVSMHARYPDLKIWDSVSFSLDQMDALCRWWLEQREQQAKEKGPQVSGAVGMSKGRHPVTFRQLINHPAIVGTLLALCGLLWLYRWPEFSSPRVRQPPKPDVMDTDETHRVTIGGVRYSATTPPARMDAERWVFRRAGDGGEVVFTGDFVCEERKEQP